MIDKSAMRIRMATIPKTGFTCVAYDGESSYGTLCDVFHRQPKAALNCRKRKAGWEAQVHPYWTITAVSRDYPGDDMDEMPMNPEDEREFRRLVGPDAPRCWTTAGNDPGREN